MNCEDGVSAGVGNVGVALGGGVFFGGDFGINLD